MGVENQGIAYKSGSYMPVGELSIGVLEPTFTKSDVIFDVVPVSQRAFFRLDDHLARFRASYEYVRMTPPCSDDEMKHIFAQCVDRAGLSDALVYMLVTRGRYAEGVAFGDPRACANEFIAYSVPYYWVVPEDCVQTGAHIHIAETRRAPDAAINQRVKSFNRMDLTQAQFEALDAGADAPVLLSTEGYVTEGPGFNVWVVKDRTVRTPSSNVLEGITRLTVLDLCAEAGLHAETVDLKPEDLENADEAFMSTSGGGVIPITRVNDKAIANGAPGLTTSALRDLYWEKRAAGWHATPVDELLAFPEPQALSAD